MAKKSAVEKNNRRSKLAARFAARRARLKVIARDRNARPEERFNARCQPSNDRIMVTIHATSPLKYFVPFPPCAEIGYRFLGF